MKFNMNEVLMDINDEPVVDEKTGEDVTIRMAIQKVMTNILVGDENVTADDKLKFWNLALDARQDEVNWTVEELALVRARVGRGYPAGIVGPAFKILTPGPEEKPEAPAAPAGKAKPQA